MKKGTMSASADSLKRKDIIKVQHNCKATGFWVKKSKEYNFLLIMHEPAYRQAGMCLCSTKQASKQEARTSRLADFPT